MNKIFNPLYDQDEQKPMEVSTSSLINDTMGQCPKCKQPFTSGIVAGATVYYCDKCRVCQPMPV